MLRMRPTALVAAWFALATSAFAASPRVKLIGNTGDLTFTDDKGMVHILKSSKRIPVGSTVQVEHGTGIVQIASAIVKIGEKDSFSLVSLTENKGALALKGVTGAPLVTLRNKTQKLSPGEIIVIATDEVEAAIEAAPPSPVVSPAPNPAQDLNTQQPVSPSSPH